MQSFGFFARIQSFTFKLIFNFGYRLVNRAGAQGMADCSNEHGLFISYTFARTQTDTLKIRVTDMDSGGSKEIEARIKPNPRALALAEKCLSSLEDSLHRWACVNAAELIPEEAEIKVRDKDELQSSLPESLAFAKSEYDLVHAVEFNSLEEAKHTFPLPKTFRQTANTRRQADT